MYSFDKKEIFFFCLFCFCFIFFSCNSLNVKTTESFNFNNTIDKVKKKQNIQKKAKFKFLGFFYTINYKQNIKMQDNGIYEIPYKFLFEFENITPKTSNFILEYTIFDANREVLLSGKQSNLIKDKFNPNQYNIEIQYIDSFSYSKLFYEIKIIQSKTTKKYTGEYVNKHMPQLTSLSFGPIVSQIINEEFIVSLGLSLSLENVKEIVWIRLIPPTLNSYWNIQWKKDKNNIEAFASVTFPKHKNYIDNGIYILQINLGKYGVIQKNYDASDILGNKEGANYGLFIVDELDNDMNNIYLSIDELTKINFLELHFFKYNDKNFEIGKIAINNPKKTISKQYLKNLIVDDKGKVVKFSPNTKYYYQIFTYSKEINNIKYISISKKYLFSISEFDFNS